MLDLSIPIPNGKHQVLLVSAATAVSAFYLFSSLRKEKKSGFKEIPIPGSSLPIFGKCSIKCICQIHAAEL
jgi:hypothetical protein